MEKHRILVIDDEQDICEILSVNLQMAGYEVETANSAEEALRLDIGKFQLILLDIMMPGMSGYRMAQLLKENKQTASIPIVFITAKDTEDDLLKGFSIGADDYIQKPFSVREVLARIKAVINRTLAKATSNEKQPTSSSISYEGLKIDTDRKTVSVDGEDVAFTPTEYHLLLLLLSERGQVFSRQQLIDRVWPSNVVVTFRTVDVNITRIRKKIGRYSNNIVTRQGFGYCFEEV